MLTDVEAQGIIRNAALRFGVIEDELLGGSRTAEVVEARDFAVRRLHEKGWSVTKIGAFFSRTHSTASRALKRQEDREAEAAKEQKVERPDAPLKRVKFVYGVPDGEHLRLERWGDTVAVISAEARSSRMGLTAISDRFFCTIPVSSLRDLLAEEGR